eukprot:Nk52_evm4s315 gene=Nk52_evmTU4s315
MNSVPLLPILKWIGSKRDVSIQQCISSSIECSQTYYYRQDSDVDTDEEMECKALIPQQHEREYLFIEPFAGSASLALSLQPSKLWLNDACLPLIHFYYCLKTNPGALIDDFKDLVNTLEGLDSSMRAVFYNDCRHQFNQYLRKANRKHAQQPTVVHENDTFVQEVVGIVSDSSSSRSTSITEQGHGYHLPIVANAEFAALFLFLNRTCFRGMYRQSNKGEFNVPFGEEFDYRGRLLNSQFLDNIMNVSMYLRKVDAIITCFPYSYVLNVVGYMRQQAVQMPMYVYLDPPYTNANFIHYLGGNSYSSHDDSYICLWIEHLLRRGEQFERNQCRQSKAYEGPCCETSGRRNYASMNPLNVIISQRGGSYIHHTLSRSLCKCELSVVDFNIFCRMSAHVRPLTPEHTEYDPNSEAGNIIDSTPSRGWNTSEILLFIEIA